MSKWLAHVKKTMKSEAGMKKSMGKKWFSHVLKTAKKSYHKKGGAESESDEEKPEMGGRRHRKSRGGKTRRHRK